MTLFLGRILPGGERRVTCLDEEGERPLDPHLHIRNHSPDGFCWGYGGSGPAQLALALLCYVCTTAEQAERLHQQFKSRVIAAIPQDMGWVLSEESVRRWVSNPGTFRLGDLWHHLLPQHRLVNPGWPGVN